MTRTTIRNTRNHVLALAVLTAIGMSGLAQAQVEAPRPAAEEEAEESRDDAVDAAVAADAAAENAAEAAAMANAALKATETGSNPIGTALEAEAAERMAHAAAHGAINAAVTAEAAASATAQAVTPPPPVDTVAVPVVPVVPVTTNAQVVTVNSMPGNSISSNYKIDFTATDKNGDGVVTRAEVDHNPDLQREFHVVDLDNNGQLTRVELQDWIDPLTLQ